MTSLFSIAEETFHVTQGSQVLRSRAPSDDQSPLLLD